MDYDDYNREERYTCSHLFRLLHEPVDGYRPIREFLKRPVKLGQFRIYSEVALIRDAYFARKPNTGRFMDDLVRLLMAQESVVNCRLYTELPWELCDGSETHPRQIREKARGALLPEEERVYGALQGMFNAKPDLAICVGDNDLFVYEAKLTLNFDARQAARTKRIGEVWTRLLFEDLGFPRQPNVTVLKLGLSRYAPDVSWEQIATLAATVYPPGDRTRAALAQAALAGWALRPSRPDPPVLE